MLACQGGPNGIRFVSCDFQHNLLLATLFHLGERYRGDAVQPFPSLVLSWGKIRAQGPLFLLPPRLNPLPFDLLPSSLRFGVSFAVGKTELKIPHPECRCFVPLSPGKRPGVFHVPSMVLRTSFPIRSSDALLRCSQHKNPESMHSLYRRLDSRNVHKRKYSNI